MYAPEPRRTNSGSSSPTACIARTGELTPPGMRSRARWYSALRSMGGIVRLVVIFPSAATGLLDSGKMRQHFSGSSEPACEPLRPVGDDDVRPGSLDGEQGLDRCLALVEPAPVRCRANHRVLAGDVVGGDGQLEPLARGADHVQIGQRRLDHHDVGSL